MRRAGACPLGPPVARTVRRARRRAVLAFLAPAARPPRAGGTWGEALDWRATALAVGLALYAHAAHAVWAYCRAGG